ncbi:MAG TPA: thiamine pyrophosphate-dependent enzyme [Bacteroidota bacterium]
MQSSDHSTYLKPDCTMPFCKGCGHTNVLRKLNDALVQLSLDPSDICLVTDIGCIGLADSLFDSPHSVHTTHGRSTAFATGIALADSVLAEKKLKTIVLIGDGGAMIGLLHLVNAALLNVDVTVVLCNNFLFGMTGGQNSAMSPLDFVTPTTPAGNIIPPLDICKIVADSHAGFVARHVATEKELSSVLAEAIAYPGFSLVEVIELCTEHGTTRNSITGKDLNDIMVRNGQSPGRLREVRDRIEFGALYSTKFPANGKENVLDGIPVPSVSSGLKKRTGIIVAGSAGEKVQSSAYRFCLSALRAGLYCTQKNDNPVTQGSGFSLSEIVISPENILYTGIERPDAVIVVSEEGLKELMMKGLFEQLTGQTKLIIDASLKAPNCSAEIHQRPFRKEVGGKKAAAQALEQYGKMTEMFSDLKKGAELEGWN